MNEFEKRAIEKQIVIARKKKRNVETELFRPHVVCMNQQKGLISRILFQIRVRVQDCIGNREQLSVTVGDRLMVEPALGAVRSETDHLGTAISLSAHFPSVFVIDSAKLNRSLIARIRYVAMPGDAKE